jgi:hypothetical protein
MVPGDIASTPLHWFMRILHWKPPTKPSPLSRASSALSRTTTTNYEDSCTELALTQVRKTTFHIMYSRRCSKVSRYFGLFAIFRQGMTAMLNTLPHGRISYTSCIKTEICSSTFLGVMGFPFTACATLLYDYQLF